MEVPGQMLFDVTKSGGLRYDKPLGVRLIRNNLINGLSIGMILVNAATMYLAIEDYEEWIKNLCRDRVNSQEKLMQIIIVIGRETKTCALGRTVITMIITYQIVACFHNARARAVKLCVPITHHHMIHGNHATTAD